ncbi:MAG: hypothetical protein AAFV53_36700 [Myxococcota bacterium]
MISPLGDARILAWLVGALEPGDALAVSEQIAADATLAVRASALSARLDRPAAAKAWRIPPPGIPGGAARLQVRTHAAAVMSDAQAVRPGERFRLQLGSLPDASRRLMVVLYRAEHSEGWSVIFPTSTDECVTLDELPAEPDGSRYLDLVAGEQPGEQRWAVALPSRDELVIDWTAPPAERWAVLQARIRDGSVPVASVQIGVRAA